MSYNTKIVREQSGSMLNVNATGSVVFHDSAVLQYGGIRFYFGSDLPTLNATAGDIYFRGGSDAGSVAGIYMNRSDGAAGGSLWTATCANTP